MALTAGKINAKDTIFGALAECYAVISGTRYNFAHVISMEASAKKTKVKVPILGQVSKGNKAAGVEYSGKMTMHYNNSILRKMMKAYDSDGTDVYFTIEVTNSDPTSDAGDQVIILNGCNLDDCIIAKFDSSSNDTLQEDVNFTFEGFNINEAFDNLSVIVNSSAA